MDFNVGDTVIHWTHGLGEITGLEERTLSGEDTLYYLVRIRDLVVFVPADGKTGCRLRSPSDRSTFKKLFAILGEPGTPLSENRFERKAQLHKDLGDGTAESLCKVIRDLSHLGREKHLNDDDRNILERAVNNLRAEMVVSLGITPGQAETDLNRLLDRAIPVAA